MGGSTFRGSGRVFSSYSVLNPTLWMDDRNKKCNCGKGKKTRKRDKKSFFYGETFHGHKIEGGVRKKIVRGLLR